VLRDHVELSAPASSNTEKRLGEATTAPYQILAGDGDRAVRLRVFGLANAFGETSTYRCTRDHQQRADHPGIGLPHAVNGSLQRLSASLIAGLFSSTMLVTWL